MLYIVNLIPRLGVTPEEFIADWNDRAQCRAMADADFAAPPSRKPDPALVNAVRLTMKPSAARTSVADAENMIREVFNIRWSGRRQVKITETVRPDGTTVIAVEPEN